MGSIEKLVALTAQKEQVKKHVAAIHTSGELSLLERKAANVLLLNAYDSLLARRTHTLPVKHLCAMLGWDESNNIDRLQDVLRKLVSTSIEFNIMEDGKEVWQVMSMLSYGRIKGGICTYRYDEYLAERLYDPEIYATINIGVQRRFEGSYALTLYENCLRYLTVGSTGWWELSRFRRIVGAEAGLYADFRRLNERVIKPSIKEINRISDIQLASEFRKQGRKVAEVRFLVCENLQQTLLRPVIKDDHAAIRESETFQRLLDHGIGERLAILWLHQDEERAKSVVEYVEARAKKKQVKGSTAGYIRTLYESDAVVGATVFEAKQAEEARIKAQAQQRQALEKRQAEREAESVRKQVAAAINALSMDDRRAWIQRYIAEMGAGKARSYHDESVEFRDKLEKLAYQAWLRRQMAPRLTSSPT